MLLAGGIDAVESSDVEIDSEPPPPSVLDEYSFATSSSAGGRGRAGGGDELDNLLSCVLYTRYALSSSFIEI